MFTPDGVIEAFDEVVVAGRDAVKPFLKSLYDLRGAHSWQHLTSHYQFRGDARECVVYCYWTLIEAKDADQAVRVRGTGYYETHCVKSDGEWLIKRRRIFHWDKTKVPWA